MMTDSELRDKAVSELQLTTDSYPAWVKKGKPDTHWAKAFAALAEIGVVVPLPPPPPSSGLLAYKPPGWDGAGDVRNHGSFPNYVPITATGPGTLYLDNSKNYYLTLGKLAWSSVASGRSGLTLNGGRDVVIVAGEIAFNSTNNTDDCAGIRIIGGAGDGTIYMEGLKISSPNCITWESPRKGVIQKCYLYASCYQNDQSHIHPDCLQIWSSQAPSVAAQLYMDYVTAHTFRTALTAIEAQPTRWRRTHVDVHQHAATYVLYLSNGDNPVTCYYDGDDTNWMELMQSWGGVKEQLQMAIDSPAWSTPNKLYYQIKRGSTENPSGPTNDPNYFHTGPGAKDIGCTQGDQWHCTSKSNITERWNYGVNPDGEYAPASEVGTGYVPVGYK